METIIQTKKDWGIIEIDNTYFIRHIPSGEYLGGKSILTAKKDRNHKTVWKLDSLEKAIKKLEFVSKQ